MAQVPLIPAVRAGGDTGTPIVVSDPDSAASIALVEAARAVARTTKTKVGKPLSLIATGAGGNGGGHQHQHQH
jgi:ATP-binding protein involved in chromosome partitioning